MAQCKECIHGECCSVFVPVRTTLCNDKADEMCELFKPTADVVSKSEVEELKKAYLHYEETTGLKQAKTDVAREIFEEIEKALNLSKCYGDSGVYFEHDIETDIAELKKKYESEGV